MSSGTMIFFTTLCPAAKINFLSFFPDLSVAVVRVSDTIMIIMFHVFIF